MKIVEDTKSSINKMNFNVWDSRCTRNEQSYTDGEIGETQYLSENTVPSGIYEFDSLIETLHSYGWYDDPKRYTIVRQIYENYDSLQADKLMNKEGDEPTDSEMESWKKGNTKLYNYHLLLTFEVRRNPSPLNDKEVDMLKSEYGIESEIQ